MRKGYVFLIALFITIKLSAQYPLTLIPYVQNFDGLGTSTSNVAGGDLNLVSGTLNGWYFSETLSNADNTITADDGSDNAGDTYNFGTTAVPERTLGGLQSGALKPTIGFYVMNNTGSTITSLTINYTGEQWRLGTAGRLDKLDFQYSQNAISLTTGNWIDANALDFTAPVTTIPLGALDGNQATNRSLVTGTIIGLYIPNGTNFFIRWNDFNASGAEDGLGIDDFTMTAGILPSSTDYFRSVQSGNWTDLSTWESSPDNTNWVAATAIPNAADNTISIKAGHIVTFSAFLPLDQAVIENGGTLDFDNGILTVDDGIGNDIDIQSGGAFVLSSANNPPAFTGVNPAVNVQGNGILRVSAAGLTTTPAAGVHAANYVYNHQSILEYTLITPFGSNNVIYFPGVAATVIPVFRITQNIGISVGAVATTIINGVFEANGNVTFTAAGTKTFRNGIKGTGNINESSSGKFIINGLTAELGGSGSLTVPVTGGLEIGTPTTVTMISDKTITGNVTLLNAGSLIELGNNNLTVTGTIGITQVTSYVKTNGTGKLTIPIVIPGAPGSKLFPIGLTSINPLFISSGSPSNYSARIVEPITPPIYANSQAVLRTWYITSSVNAPAATISFGYSSGDWGVFYNNSGPAEVGVNISSVWNIHQSGLTPAIFPLVSGTFIVTPNPINYFNNPTTEFPFVIANNFAVLPIDCIVSCRSKKINNTGFISWEMNTCAEVNSFDIQRSINGGAYQTIGTVTPATQLEYSFPDISLAKGTNLYRIKVNRSSGAIKYSNTVAIINDTKGILITALSPNPVKDNALLIINGARAGAVNFTIYDIMSRPVKQWESVITEGSNTVHINAAGLPGGIYHLAASNSDSKTVIRFVKE